MKTVLLAETAESGVVDPSVSDDNISMWEDIQFSKNYANKFARSQPNKKHKNLTLSCLKTA